VDARQAPSASDHAEGGSERLLVVEDDPAVLAFTVDLLKGLGYEVIMATDAKSALSMIRSKKRIDGLFSDVIMPGGLSGIELARSARAIRPGLKILLTSGYLGDRPADTAEFPLIDKPYERNALASKLREILNARPPSEPQAPAKGRRKGGNAAQKALSDA
jgi:CheY-like chemotaxis protein